KFGARRKRFARRLLPSLSPWSSGGAKHCAGRHFRALREVIFPIPCTQDTAPVAGCRPFCWSIDSRIPFNRVTSPTNRRSVARKRKGSVVRRLPPGSARRGTAEFARKKCQSIAFVCRASYTLAE